MLDYLLAICTLSSTWEIALTSKLIMIFGEKSCANDAYESNSQAGPANTRT